MPSDPREIAAKLTKAQAAALRELPVEAPAVDFGASGVACNALVARGLFTSRSDRWQWGRSVYSVTDLGCEVAAELRKAGKP